MQHNTLQLPFMNGEMFFQKRAGLCNVPEDYYYLSAKLYFDGANSFGMLKHYSGN